jgi:hypothetical protein
VRRLEDAGAEVWLNDLCECICYTNAEQLQRLKLYGRQVSWQPFGARLGNHVQHKDQRALQKLFCEDFRGKSERSCGYSTRRFCVHKSR